MRVAGIIITALLALAAAFAALMSGTNFGG